VLTAGAKDGGRVVSVAETTDVILVPGGRGSQVEMENPTMREFVRRQVAGVEWTT
jgi:putative intracellular protease/amidase